ncbi:MAG: hypothetical protein HC922_07395 [Leptolyngbyaceae cyanobacterium SM2_3_12]|nr:hypothetical protein [Leptolyngbyaceae cyanobacterium SM2_3_12]
MADQQDPPIRLELELSPDQPGLLEGLETWLKLGLISESQLRDLCQTQLSCELIPEFEPFSLGNEDLTDSSNPFASAEFVREPGEPENPAITDFVPEAGSSAAPSRPRRLFPPSRSTRDLPPRPATVASSSGSSAPRPPSPLNLWLNRLMTELSVVWLLGLGVFLVVLSSAVLAATQWARFNAIGQYLVLLAYTLVFWGAGIWCSRSPNLQLTAKTLRMITLLLLPLNFWAMDALGVWRASGGWLIGLLATGLLTLAALQVLRQQRGSPPEQATVLGLAYLHTGWAMGWMPILAVYGGTLASAVAAVYGQSHRHEVSPRPQGWPTVTGIVALGLLLLRALTVIEPQQWGQLGLAFGLYGATWVWLGQRRLGLPPQPGEEPGEMESVVTPNPADRWIIGLGRGLMGWGWLIAIANWLAQAFGVSALGLGLRLQSLHRFGKRRDLLIAYSIAVQMAFVGWQLVPQALRQRVMTALTTGIDGQGGGPNFALLGLSLFPYIVVMVALGDWYFRHRQPRLGRFSDGIALGSSILLTGISAFSSPVLVVNLIASTITAWVVTLRRTPLAQWRIMLTYGLGLATLIVTVDQRWPTLALARWMMVMLALAVVALGLSKALRGLWGYSAWFYGLGLSALTYTLLGAHLADSGFESRLSGLGLVIPLTLTLIGRHQASILATGIALPLTLGLPWTRLVGLGTATGLAGVNSRYHRHRLVPSLAIGYGLGFVVSGLEDLLPGFPRQAVDWCGVTLGLMVLLWATWRWLPAPSGEETSPTLTDLYRRASDGWGHTLAFGLLGVMTFMVGLVYLGWAEPQPMALVALGGFLPGLWLRYGRRSTPVTVYLAGWGLELLLAWAWAWRYDNALALAAPTLGLGALALGLSAVSQRARPQLSSPLQTLTLGYAGLALLLRVGHATAWTGWLVVGAALLVLEIGRRNQIPPVRWLALGGLSVGWYELVIYQMRQASGGAAADGLIILAGQTQPNLAAPAGGRFAIHGPVVATLGHGGGRLVKAWSADFSPGDLLLGYLSGWLASGRSA